VLLWIHRNAGFLPRRQLGPNSSEKPKMEIEMLNECCPECFINFSLPRSLYKARCEDGEPIFCPVGHEMFYDGDDSGKSNNKGNTRPDDRRKRQEKIRQLHELEQAEARIAEKATGQPQSEQAEESAPSDCGLKQCDDPMAVLEWHKGEFKWHATCRLCKPRIDGWGFVEKRREYKHAGHIARHFREKHALKLTIEQCRPPDLESNGSK
jgi:hypothetical protein